MSSESYPKTASSEQNQATEVIPADSAVSAEESVPLEVVTSVSDAIQDTVDIVDQVSEYGFLIANSLYLIIGGMLAIFILHKIASRFLYPHIKNPRIIKVLFGALYVLILVVAILIVLKRLGFDVSVIAEISILIVLVGAVAVFFLVPFLPRLPFKLGHMVELNGELGTVDSISTFHTTVRTFDGTMVFIPNAVVMATKIKNYHDIPERRIEIKLSVNLNSDMEILNSRLCELMNDDQRVLDNPPPRVLAVTVDASGINFNAYCWVKNSDWLSVRSALTLKILKEFETNQHISMSRSQQEVFILDQKQRKQ